MRALIYGALIYIYILSGLFRQDILLVIRQSSKKKTYAIGNGNRCHNQGWKLKYLCIR